MKRDISLFGRNPRPKEMKDLLSFIMKQEGLTTRREALEVLDNAYISVFDQYQTDMAPGFQGRVLIVLWGSSPDEVESYIWEDGKIRKAGKYNDT